MAKKNKMGELQQAVDTLIKNSKNVFILAEIEGKGLVDVAHLHGEDGHSAFDTLTNMLTAGLANIVRTKDAEYNQKITQGKIDLAYLLSLDILHNTLKLGATDYAEIHEDIEPEGDSWVDDDDIKEAENNTDVLCYDDEDEGEETTVVAPKDIKELVEALQKVLGGDDESDEEVKCFCKKLSKSEQAELKKVLDKIEGRGED